MRAHKHKTFGGWGKGEGGYNSYPSERIAVKEVDDFPVDGDIHAHIQVRKVQEPVTGCPREASTFVQCSLG